MNNKILEQMEFVKVKNLFAVYLQTEQGEQELAALTPMTEEKKIKRAFAEILDMEAVFTEAHSFGVGQIQDISVSIQRLQADADLDLTELLGIKHVLLTAADLKRFYADLENVSLTELQRLFEDLTVFPQLQGSLQAVNDAGFIEDFASPDLTKIRRQLRQREAELRQLLQDLLKKQAEFLSEKLIASRNGRSVLPVKNTHRHRIPGVVHDISASGATVYIEPRGAVNLHEEISRLQADERYEIQRILHDLSQLLRPHTASLLQNAWIIGHIDLVRSKYFFLRDYKGTVPSVSKDKTIHLLAARHPLLTDPVPNDLQFADDLKAILITGPNTGGKTIMLKTLGLAQLMAQAGLPILAAAGSKIAVFRQVFADIGDEQSIEQSLSTFSSHMTQIVAVLNKADQDSLVLFDELGAGTDPKEGAGLAMGVLEYLRSLNIKTMVTTHYPELKAYGIMTDFVANASMEFDQDSLRPTYRFLQGVPGRSNAFEIARRLGLSDTIIKKAEELTEMDSDANSIIEELEKQTLESRRRLEHIAEIEEENKKFNRAVKKLYNEFSHARDQELLKASKQAQEIVDRALSESDEILKNLREQSALKPHEIIAAKGRLKELAPAEELSKNKVLKKVKHSKAPHAGDDIVITAYGQRGTLTKQLKDGKWEAQVGLIKMTVGEDEFTLAKNQTGKQSSKKKELKVVKKTNRSSSPHARLDLRGKRYEEAMQELDAFIDQALLNNMTQVDIIHGIGTGVIRQGVTQYLRRNKHVKKFAYAPQNAGGSGCTIAHLG
ncbi:endonuclease MutS2 [Streptococcus pantholopis]|uniref:Endonuclease MutS2 n=1 Tax=Streptococcus pantholopis TaxID=1811193 RepID=A0A172Q592_9STRE|nr:endonuclease MutS2 [Streptococcus pantholopis]AND78641.1 DNA mismatch repair protein MutS [Streptococcus pantholopis]